MRWPWSRWTRRAAKEDIAKAHDALLASCESAAIARESLRVAEQRTEARQKMAEETLAIVERNGFGEMFDRAMREQ